MHEDGASLLTNLVFYIIIVYWKRSTLFEKSRSILCFKLRKNYEEWIINMKKIISIILLICMLGATLIACGNDQPPVTEDEKGKLYVGYGRENISPTEPAALSGYADVLGRMSTKVRDDLFASCTAFRDEDGNTALLYTLDLHSISVGLAEYLHRLIEAETGVSKDNIILNVTHTHAAPATDLLGSDTYLKGYAAIFFDGIVNSAKAALDDLSECTGLFAGTLEINNMNFIRRYECEDGSYASVTTKITSPRVAYETDVDNHMPIVKFVREGKKDIILANWAAHCDTVSGSDAEEARTSVSADYISAIRSTVESKTDSYISVHMAASGDVNPSSRLEGAADFPGTTQYGRTLGFSIIDGLETLEELEIDGSVKMLTTDVRVTVDHSRDDEAAAATQALELFNQGNIAASDAIILRNGFNDIYEAMMISGKSKRGVYQRINVSVLSIGNIAFGVAPYEMFTDNGRNVKNAGADKDYDLTFMCAYSNGMIGYIPTELAFEHGEYEVYSCQFVKGTAEQLQNEIIRLLGEASE